MIDKLIKDIIKKSIEEFKKEENKVLIEKDLINPLLKNFTDRIYPYVSLLFIMYSLNLVLIIIILILIILYNNKKNI
jgi:hypothetical protein